MLRAFYLSVILVQHSPSWNLLLANVDATMKPFSGISKETLEEAAPKLIELDHQQADKDLTEVEDGLTRDTLGFLLLEQMKLKDPQGFLGVLQKEKLSSLFRSLALLLAVDNLLGNSPAIDAHKEIIRLLDSEERGKIGRAHV